MDGQGWGVQGQEGGGRTAQGGWLVSRIRGCLWLRAGVPGTRPSKHHPWVPKKKLPSPLAGPGPLVSCGGVGGGDAGIRGVERGWGVGVFTRGSVESAASLACPPPQIPQAARNRSGDVGRRRGWVWGGPVPGGRALLDDHAAGQVLGEVLEELGGGSGAVGELQLLQLLQLHQPRQARGGQQGAACKGTVPPSRPRAGARGVWGRPWAAGAPAVLGRGVLGVPKGWRCPRARPLLPLPGLPSLVLGSHRRGTGGAGCPCPGGASGQNPAPGKETGVGPGWGQAEVPEMGYSIHGTPG